MNGLSINGTFGNNNKNKEDINQRQPFNISTFANQLTQNSKPTFDLGLGNSPSHSPNLHLNNNVNNPFNDSGYNWQQSNTPPLSHSHTLNQHLGNNSAPHPLQHSKNFEPIAAKTSQQSGQLYPSSLSPKNNDTSSNMYSPFHNKASNANQSNLSSNNGVATQPNSLSQHHNHMSLYRGAHNNSPSNAANASNSSNLAFDGNYLDNGSGIRNLGHGPSATRRYYDDHATGHNQISSSPVPLSGGFNSGGNQGFNHGSLGGLGGMSGLGPSSNSGNNFTNLNRASNITPTSRPSNILTNPHLSPLPTTPSPAPFANGVNPSPMRNAGPPPTSLNHTRTRMTSTNSNSSVNGSQSTNLPSRNLIGIFNNPATSAGLGLGNNPIGENSTLTNGNADNNVGSFKLKNVRRDVKKYDDDDKKDDSSKVVAKKPYSSSCHRVTTRRIPYHNYHDDTKWYSLRIEGKVRNVSPVLWQFTHLTKLDMHGNNIKIIPNAISNLKSLLLLDISQNLIKTLPNSMGNLLELRELNISYNRIKNLPHSIGRLFNLQALNAEGNDISPQLMSLMSRDNGCQDLLFHLYEHYIHTNSELYEKIPRDWMVVDDVEVKEASGGNVTVMTYNILSETFATTQQYGYCPPWALEWSHRSEQLLEEIGRWLPDIICLQELEKRVYQGNFTIQLEHLGYSGIYSQKSRAKTMYMDQQEHIDGCAIFYKTEYFNPIMDYTIEFNHLACKVVDGLEHQEQLINRIMTKDNIGLLVLFEWNPMPSDPASIPTYILAANAHLHWDPEFSDVKLIQTILLSNAIHKMRVAATTDPTKPPQNLNVEDFTNPKYTPTHKDEDIDADKLKLKQSLPALAGASPDSIPVIVAGDFNSLPDSGVTKFMLEGAVQTTHPDFNNYAFPEHFTTLQQQKYQVRKQHGKTQNSKLLSTTSGNTNTTSDKVIKNTTEEILHPINLKSAYDINCKDTPFTNFTYEFKGMIDYIFYSKEQFTLKGRLKGIGSDWFKQHHIPGCPFINVPSDHLPLLAEFAFHGNGGKRDNAEQRDSGGNSFFSPGNTRNQRVLSNNIMPIKELMNPKGGGAFNGYGSTTSWRNQSSTLNSRGWGAN